MLCLGGLACVILTTVMLWGSGRTDSREDLSGGTGEIGAAGGRSEAVSGEVQMPGEGSGAGSEKIQESAGEDGKMMSGEEEPDGGSGREIRLVMVGDILLHTPVADSGRLPEGGYDFGAVFAQMKEEISSADLALVNQEVIIGGEELGVSGYPAFNAPYELGDALAEAGFDVVLHATNHALDKGKKGILNCLSYWREKHPSMAVLGIHDSSAGQEEIYVYEQEGIRIAILNYTYGTNGIALPEDMPFAVDLMEKEKMQRDLQKARQEADFVVVCPHWGTEYLLSASQEQKDWAEWFAENGADLVLGTHPHVIEPFEWVDGGDRSALVYYSLGNFVNWTSGTGEGVANRMVGAMVEVTIGLDDENKAGIKSYDAEPVVCHVEQGFGGVSVWPLAQYTPEMAARNEIIKQDDGFTYEYCRELAHEILGTFR